MNWIDDIVKKSSIIVPNCIEELQLVDKLIEIAESPNFTEYTFGEKLAAFYDLAISVVYYTNISNSGWLYCDDPISPKLFLPFVNCSPKDALQGNFIFHKSSKPTSAKIGQATSRILLLFFQTLFRKRGYAIDVLKACEPADAIFIDRKGKNIYFAEIKSSPLLTMAISTKCDRLSSINEIGDFEYKKHTITSNPNLINNELYLMLPVSVSNKNWTDKYFLLGKKGSNSDELFAYKGMLNLINDNSFIQLYLHYWHSSYILYGTKDESENIFWLTNACGKPSILPDSWTGGVTCISDEKTSVGMDRTDDIKKGIYQVLKLGSEGKILNSAWNYKVGIISNIHRYRHYDTYIKPIKDLIWTIAKESGISTAADLPSETPMYNLFDGIITFTKSYVRDNWILECLKNLRIYE